jgi:succinyl-CoA:acetate CoA-transferase
MKSLSQKIMSAVEAADLIKNGECIGISGFTLSGYPKAVPEALAEKAIALHQKGEPFKVTIFSGASTGDDCDGVLARAQAIEKRMPYQSNPSLRQEINQGLIQYRDEHLGSMGPMVRSGALERPTLALIECIAVTPEGKVYLSSSGGNSVTYLECADRVILEVNSIYGEEYIVPAKA